MGKVHYTVRAVTRSDAKEYILSIHYAKRWPSISYYFGLFLNEELVGVVTYGQPASPWLCKGVCGDELRSKVIELNRLVLRYNRKNEASILISKSLKMLPNGLVVVSYADTKEGHRGTVYMATNWIYTGATKPRTDMASTNGGHSRHNAGDRTKRVYRSSKHRFVTFTGTKRDKKFLRSRLNYQEVVYPTAPPNSGGEEGE